jgi:SAM-dependent methyltransferase
LISAGAATLIVELALIRWVPGQIRVLGYFTNFVLLSAFLGFGVGMLCVRRWPASNALSHCAPFALLGVIGLAELGTTLHVLPSSEEFLFLEYRDRGAPIPLYPFLLLSFIVLAASFVPLGHVVGRTLAGPRPLIRYALNLVGSLLGIGLFALLSASRAAPWIWMLLAGTFSAVGLWGAGRVLKLLGAVAIAAIALISAQATRGAIWSPYQKITVGPVHVHPELGVVQEWELPGMNAKQRAEVKRLPESEGFTIRVNDDSYQTPLGLSNEAVKRTPELAALRRQYDLPFRIKRAERVLVLGAGSGNDVAGALRNGAKSVDAVDIDPVILELGRKHPDRPYEDARVHVHLDDARSFLSRATQRWDAIVFGLIDSHVLANHHANVRLDSFVFTKESFALARQRLTPGGMMIVSHALGAQWFMERMHATIAAAFDRPPLLVSAQIWHPLGRVYAAGETVPMGAPVVRGTVLLEDDWPFLYLERPTIPLQYVIAMALILLISTFAVRRVAGPRWEGVDGHFFALGAGFMLLETRALIQLALHLGATWSVNAAVFTGVLVMALLSTVIASRRSATGFPIAAYASLGLLLAISAALPASALSALPFGARVSLSVITASLPLLASGVVFSIGLARAGSADRALASNLLGAMVGGIVEYSSMLLGIHALLPLAAIFYLYALFTDVRMRAPAKSPALITEPSASYGE